MIVGASGMLGQDLVASVPATVELFAFSRPALDVTNARGLEAIIREIRPDVIINAAAFTAVDQAETERSAAFAVNGTAVGMLGRAASVEGVRVVHFSTDYVFDGTGSRPYEEDDRAMPINAYGASKLAGELALAESTVVYLLLRTSWLFGAHGRSFPRTMRDRAVAGLPSRVVSDQTGRPTYSLDLARATWKLIALKASGVMHVANTGVATWYDVARRVYSTFGAEHLVEPCSTADFPTPAKRPAWSVLSTTRVERALDGPLPPWDDAIDRFLGQIKHLPPAPRIAT